MHYNSKLIQVLFDNNTLKFREQNVLLDIFLYESLEISLQELRSLLNSSSKKFTFNELVVFTAQEIDTFEQLLLQQNKPQVVVQQLRASSAQPVFGVMSSAIPKLFKLVRSYKLRNSLITWTRSVLCLKSSSRKIEQTNLDCRNQAHQAHQVSVEGEVESQDLSPVTSLVSSSVMQESLEAVCIRPSNPQITKQEIIKIVQSAQNNVCYFDRYVDLETLSRLAAGIERGREMIFNIVTENRGKSLSKTDLVEFHKSYPNIKVCFRQLQKTHDRFIIIDSHLKRQPIYHLGASLNKLGNDHSQIAKICPSVPCYNQHNSLLRNLLGTAEITLDNIKNLSS